MKAGPHIQITETGIGRAISAKAGARQWRHPWSVRPAWIAASGRWVATVKAGFVNGKAPVVRTTVETQAEADRSFGINPLTGQKIFFKR